MMVPKHRERPREVSQGYSCRYIEVIQLQLLTLLFYISETYIAQPFYDSWVSGASNQDIDFHVQQYSSCSNDVVEVGTGELDKSEYRMAK